MESLPDELLLLIFRYLHQFDILYAFQNLNRRFQQIIERYLHDIDVTQENTPSYKHFQLLIKHVLPLQGRAVRSLKLDVEEQKFELFCPFIRRLTNLESLK
jgi:hypothetical protein